MKPQQCPQTIPPEPEEAGSVKVKFTMNGLRGFQHTADVNVDLALDKEKAVGGAILEHHKRPNYNNQQRRLLAKGRQTHQQLASNCLADC